MSAFRSIGIGISAIFLIPPTANSEELTARGLGLAGCSELLVWDSEESSLSLLWSWTYGFWSGENRLRAVNGLEMKNLGHSSVETEPLIAQLVAYCRRRPTDLIANGAIEIFERLPEITLEEATK